MTKKELIEELTCGVSTLTPWAENLITKFEETTYQQGRADKYQEITTEYMLLTEKQVAEIRADANDEALQEFAQWLWDSYYLVDEAFTIRLVEQYKKEVQNE